MLIDAATNRQWGACYSDERLAELYDHPHTLTEVLTRDDGRWADVPIIDRLWVFFRAVTPTTLNEFLARMLERLKDAGKLTDPRSLAVIPALRSGTMTQEIIDAAYAAACAADAAAIIATGNATGIAAIIATGIDTGIAHAAAFAAHAAWKDARDTFRFASATTAASLAARSIGVECDATERSRQLNDAIELASNAT